MPAGFENEHSWNHNIHYYDLLLRSRSWPCVAALDVGCGDGRLVRALAKRAHEVVGIDSSAAMIGRARQATSNANVEYVQDDFVTHDFAGRRFDFITCVAALHHMDLSDALERMKALLLPNGTLAVVGLARASTLPDLAYGAVGFFASRLRRLRGRTHDAGAPVAAPAETYGEIERRARDILPGAAFRRLVLFRYLLTWTKSG